MNRPGASNLRYLAAAAAGAALIVGALFFFAPGERETRGEPNIDALKAVLERSADEVLPPPTVANTEILLETPTAQRDAEIERIVSIATGLGGTALRSESAEGDLEVLAQIPVGKIADFRAQVTGEDTFAGPDELATDEPTKLVVVKFRGKAKSPPTATPASPASPAP